MAEPILPETSSKNIISIQYLRAFAAIGVVIFHLAEPLGWNFHGAATGVDLFFVISGFIMWLVTQHKERPPLTFLKRRVLRVVPLYWGATLFMAALVLLKPNLFPLDHVTTSHLSLSLLFVPHVSPAGNYFPLLGLGWTLNYEMFFYILLTTSLFFSRERQLMFLTGAMLMLVAVGYICPWHGPFGSTYLSPILLEFLSGIYIGKLWLKGTPFSKIQGQIFLVVGLVAMAAGWLFGNIPTFLTQGIPSVLIVLGITTIELKGKIIEIGLLKFLGDASYSIYLTHDLSMLVVMLAAAHLGMVYNDVFYVVGVLGAIFIGSTIYIAMEKPVALLLSRKFPSKAPSQVHRWSFRQAIK